MLTTGFFNIIYLLVIISEIETQTTCPQFFTELHGQCYFVSSTRTAGTWLQARTYCQTIGGDLLIHPPDLLGLRNFVNSYTAVSGSTCVLQDCLTADRWMGGGRPTSGKWVWLSGNDNIPWQSPWPRLTHRGPACLTLNPSNGIYKDSHCEARLPFICIPRTLRTSSAIAPGTASSPNVQSITSRPITTTTQATVTERQRNANTQLNSGIACGVPWTGDERTNERIVSGREVLFGEFPWMVHISYFSSFLDNLVPCGGSIIADRWVLTAAHCFKHLEPFVDVILKIGFVDLRRNDQGNQVFLVTHQNILRHSQFGENTLENDIALILLPKKLSFNQIIQPICLGSENHIKFNGTTTATGWGKLKAGDVETPSKLQVVELNIVPEESCKSKQFFICAFARGRDTCNGDSGGPLMVKENGRWHQIGIVSHGPIDCGNTNTPGIYTRVPSYLPWIWSNIRV